MKSIPRASDARRHIASTQIVIIPSAKAGRRRCCEWWRTRKNDRTPPTFANRERSQSLLLHYYLSCEAYISRQLPLLLTTSSRIPLYLPFYDATKHIHTLKMKGPLCFMYTCICIDDYIRSVCVGSRSEWEISCFRGECHIARNIKGRG